MSAIRPRWYLTPYILWLGFADWFIEQARKPEQHVWAQARRGARRKSYRAVKRAGVGAGLFGLLVLFTAHVAGPAAGKIGQLAPAAAIPPASAVLGAAAALVLVIVGVRRVTRVVGRGYRRGLRVWRRRREPLYVD